MFDRRGPWEKRLHATGITSDGKQEPIPLTELFRYARGATPLRAYDQFRELNRPAEKAQQQAFASYLGQRMAARGVHLTAIDLHWEHIHVISDARRETPIGHFELPPVGSEAPHE